ncbi:hypothetical protein BJ085DRAFT_14864 [Dimargaris cristalligena]|uniref:HotDog domain-containing protein n=1 Tax=Dimargaris cristalligena TaxID=215637 RepID=A0A4P9ZT74_9FUNG|nr:hypothetical protein BJ085DRAFT_14864 [Dimargaris cristalligena]|eukprot:RKP36774.1 hypothetical protein BJ085DRAFT_14864 [Dimargaris cristalligena]
MAPLVSQLGRRVLQAPRGTFRGPAAHYFSEVISPLDAWKAEAKQRRSVVQDTISATPLHLLALTIDPASAPEVRATQAEVPPNWHLIYFPDAFTETELSADGYDATYAPPAPYLNRVWAGGELEWSPTNPLQVGQQAAVTSECSSMDTKHSARLGPLVFVTLLRQIQNDRGWSVTEKRSLAYSQPPEKQSTPPPAAAAKRSGSTITRRADFSRTIDPTEIMLFRYSALTFNSHRIHYDQPYATQVEGHRNCLVHGPLTCTLLLNLARAQFRTAMVPRQFKKFTYRAVSSLFCGEPFTVKGKWTTPAADGTATACELWAENPNGGLAMSGTLEFY